jgi:formylglycine-generating enzyme required for sulfatase activity/predicted Ser/Thr protein kinase
MWQPNQTIENDRFLIQEVLGGGGFGVAYRAFDRKNNQPVVIKTLNQRQQNQADFEQQQKKFVNEAMTLKGLKHPHIVKVYELIQEDGLWGMVMEYLDGQELAAYVEQRKQLTEQQALGYIEQVGTALVYVHQEGILHRDIKPHNIMLRAGNREAVLIDFGLARGFIDGRTLSMTNSLTPAYAPIEQYERHGHFGAYTDVYALAATLYHLLTGTPPLPSNYRQLNYPLSPPSSLNPQISKALEVGIMKGMELQPQDRPQTMGEFLQLLGLGAQASPSVQFQPIYQPQAAAPSPSKAGNTPKLTKIQFISVKLDNKGKIVSQPESHADIFNEDLGNGVQLTMVKIPSGKFLMGSPENEAKRDKNESPQHNVSISEFYLGKTLITQAQWVAIIGNNLAGFRGDDKLPVEQVNWLEAMDFCQKLSKKTGRTYRLPSEAEWEYACRADTNTSFVHGETIHIPDVRQLTYFANSNTPFAFGETITPAVVNYDGQYPYLGSANDENRNGATSVGSFPPNLFGLYDMHGNLWEWCLDEWVDNYNGAPNDGSARGDTKSTNKNKRRLLRGGSWNVDASNCRSASRTYFPASVCLEYIGFRVACAL